MMNWNFFADRGGTFCDVIGISPAGKVFVYKLLSENPERYKDAVVQGIRDIFSQANVDITKATIDSVKVGTTVATNALLERKGTPTVLVTTKGFGDALRIGYQNRPDIFALEIILPETLYTQVIEVRERYDAAGNELIPLNLPQIRQDLQPVYHTGVRSCAIAFLHSYQYRTHERQVAEIAREIGFTQVSVSHEVSPLMKFISRGWTTVVDAYLSPILQDYVDRVRSELATLLKQQPRLFFMKSDGGLVDANFFRGITSILSGPAGGIVGAVKTSQIAGFEKIIGFDMGGTSTDVSHFNGEYERTFETEVAGVKVRTPMMSIHTVAAGGGSILHFDGSRYRVGPDSAGANPGPACYRRGGTLTITDANVMLGKISPQFFPAIFGVSGDLPLDKEIVVGQFTALTQHIQAVTGDTRTPEQVAAGFIDIAVENMANAIKKISLQRGYDVSNYTLCCFGGAGGQHACLIADRLGIQRIFIHPYAGVLSAYGIGMADIRVSKETGVEKPLDRAFLPKLEEILNYLIQKAQIDLKRQNPEHIEQTQITRKVHLKYEGTDTPLMVNFDTLEGMRQQFETAYLQQFGFLMPDRTIIVSLVWVELSCPTYIPNEPLIQRQNNNLPQPIATVSLFTSNAWHNTPVYRRDDLQPGDCITGTALIIEATGTNVIEPGWQAQINECNHLILQRYQAIERENQADRSLSQPDPVKLEIFQNLYQFIAEEMGIALQKTAASVNIRERLDFSCAIFDRHGQLVANAPHIPVHLGSMGDSVQSLIDAVGNNLQSGDVYLSNNPYNGGTHLPDVTVITPVFDRTGRQIIFYVASRGHQADIGGITPGSMPPNSTNILEEGILIDNFKIVDRGRFQASEIRHLLLNHPYPVRNLEQNLADFKAQIAANVKGLQELQKMVEQYGLETVQAYMGFVQNNAQEAVHRAIEVLNDGEFTDAMDNGGVIKVAVKIDRSSRSAIIDFTGTSAQLNNNFNAPSAIVKAAVLYVFRTLTKDNIPLNSGCLRPLNIIIPDGSFLNPQSPAAVVAGNVETSQAICNALYGALGVMAAAQGTMNNFTFGNERYQFYTTLAGGSGAGSHFNGTSAIQTAMTNSRLTDPEVLETRFPVLLERFSIRPHSGGEGQYRGGDGVIYRLRFLEPMTAGILSSSRIIPPFGLKGGKCGQVGQNYIHRRDGTVERLDSTATVEMNEGDVFIIETPGGGGYSLA